MIAFFIKHTPMHYAWVIVVVGIISNMLAAGYMFWAIAVYIPAIAEYFSIGRLPVILCFTAGQALSALCSPSIGRFMDEHGARKSLVIGSLIASLGFIVTERSPNIYVVLIGWLIVGIARPFVLPITFSWLITRWFVAHRRAALGLVTTGLGLGGVMLPFLTYLTEMYSWQFTLYSASILFPLLNIAFALFLIKDQPKDCGILSVGSSNTLDDEQTLTGINLDAAKKTSTFWIVTIGFVFFFMGQGAVNLLGLDFLLNEGITNAAIFLGVSSLIRALGRIPGSILVNRINNIFFLAILVGLLQGLAMLTIVFSTKLIFLITFVLLWGGGGIFVPMLEALILTKTFGVKHYGAISGLVLAFAFGGQIVAPILGGWVFDITNSYAIPFVIYSVMSVISCVLFYFAYKTSENVKF
jgi:MFS family permease